MSLTPTTLSRKRRGSRTALPVSRRCDLLIGGQWLGAEDGDDARRVARWIGASPRRLRVGGGADQDGARRLWRLLREDDARARHPDLREIEQRQRRLHFRQLDG